MAPANSKEPKVKAPAEASTHADSPAPLSSSAAEGAAPDSAHGEPGAAPSESGAIDGDAQGCPTCGGTLLRHPDEGNPFKAGCWHCLGACGTCWLPDLSGPRA